MFLDFGVFKILSTGCNWWRIFGHHTGHDNPRYILILRDSRHAQPRVLKLPGNHWLRIIILLSIGNHGQEIIIIIGSHYSIIIGWFFSVIRQFVWAIVGSCYFCCSKMTGCSNPRISPKLHTTLLPWSYPNIRTTLPTPESLHPTSNFIQFHPFFPFATALRSDVTWRLARLSRTDLPGVRQISVAKVSEAALASWLCFESEEEMENWNMGIASPRIPFIYIYFIYSNSYGTIVVFHIFKQLLLFIYWYF